MGSLLEDALDRYAFMESFYYQNEEWVSPREAVNWIYYGRGNHEPPTLKNSNHIFEELKEAIESKQIKVMRLDKTRAFKMEEGLFFNAGDISAFFKIELYLFYKTVMDHFFFIEKKNIPEAPAPNPIQEKILPSETRLLQQDQLPQQEPINEKPKRESKATVVVAAFMDAYIKKCESNPATADQLLAFCLKNPVVGYSDILDSGGIKKMRKISFTSTRRDSIFFVAFEKALDAIRRD